MKGSVTYRQLVLRENGEVLRLPLIAPLNDLLGLLRRYPRPADKLQYLPWLSNRYGSLGGRRHEGFLAEAREREVQDAFLLAAKAAAKGKLSADLAPRLERLRFGADGTVDVPDFAALAAWSLLEAVRRQPLELRTCPQCKAKWLARPEESDYCQRVAPGQVTRDCRTLA